MIKRLLLLFGVPKIWFLNRGSKQAVAMFTKSLSKLKQVNEEILAHHSEHQQTIDNALQAQKDLMESHGKNSKFVANLEKMFE